MRPELRTLVQLQRIDLKLAELLKAKDALPKEIEAGRAGLKATQESIEQDKTSIEALQKDSRAKERRIDEVREGQRKSKGRLMEVKTNEEYSALLKEIEYADQQIDQLEEEMLGLMERVEAAQVDLKALQDKLKVEEERFNKEKGVKEEELLRVGALLEDEEALRKEFVGQLPSDLLSNYERIRTSKNGLAVAEVVDAVCQGCNQRIPPQTYIDIKTDAIIYFCQGCSRILFRSDEGA